MMSSFARQRRPRHRFLFAAVAVLFTLYFSVGHGFHQANDGMKTMHGTGICLVLVAAAAALGVAVIRWRPPQTPPPLLVLLAAPAATPHPIVPLLPSRASPVWLQRFLR